ncbi:MAG: UbiD family decarboxylase, partial [Dehalococcoidia bacterium]|nr:UbiD family decarboxylase [Dehalococcoidia bacterium]
KKIKFNCHQAMKKPLPYAEVSYAPCQELVLTENIDVERMLPIIKHSEADGARILGGGNVLVTGKYHHGGTEVSFKRMHFRGSDWASMEIGIGSHIWDTCQEFRGQKIPVSVNIGTPPAVVMVAATMFPHTVVPYGLDEIGFSGALQGTPVELVKCRTVDAFSIANSEIVIEGYIDTTKRVWETEEGEISQKAGTSPVMPEWTGYLGRDYRGFRFDVTAITHRKDRPMFFTPLAKSFESDFAGSGFREASFFELAQRIARGVVVDVNILNGLAANAGGIIYQVKKRRGGDEGYQRNILSAALGSSQGIRMVVIVDEDIDIYSAEDVLWALSTRLNPATGILRGSVGGIGFPMMPTERTSPGAEAKLGFWYEGGMGLDATAPYSARDNFRRAHYPVDRIDLTRWLTPEQINKAQSYQNEYARTLSRMGA